MRYLITFILLLLSFNVADAQQRPLITEDVEILPPGSFRIETGVEFFQDAEFPVSGLTGDLTRVGVVGLHVGLAPNVELQIDGVLQNFLSVKSAGASAVPLSFNPATQSTNDVGDFTLATKIKLRKETRRMPSFGFRFGVQLPNTNQARGIGLNQTNAFGTILVGKRFGKDGRLNTFGNLGMAILSSPLSTTTQNDVLLYGLAGIYRLNDIFNIAAEVHGRANTRSGAAPLGTEAQSEARLGLQIKTSGLRFDIAGMGGLSEFSPRSGVIFGVTYQTSPLFETVK